ncbi:hypothetical protein [Vagococcus fessus]|uniref:Uncharacterized protein n=1 Tax=Vagococcus fessus TaxID=120370 RepID=A0A430A6F7_9ENTE|nr:hypothetical protein [Vagococcus fessus]RSU02438.1 hypothetical protein CBF31_08700 [Vagococcus fessus]
MVEGLLLEISDTNQKFQFKSSITSAMIDAELELDELEETMDSIEILKPDCDKLDYQLAISSGALCGCIDVFMVGVPKDSALGNMTDKWFEKRTKYFAKLNGWKDSKSDSISSAIRFLEKKFKVPYDQRGAGDIGQFIENLTPKNHHFKSIAHNPSILGLFVSLLDQFNNKSHFVSGGKLEVLNNTDGSFKLQGDSFISRLFCGVVNWLGHLMSDVAGASGSKTRGMGIPSPLWTWTNSVIAIKKKLKIEPLEFDKNINELASKIYNEGYDTRFQTTQMIPVVINELVIRFLYSIRRMIQYFSSTEKRERSFEELWDKCEPFKNVSVKRMLTVAHGAFCLIDLGDATARGVAKGGGSFNIVEFFLRVNLVGVGKFTISLYGETKLSVRNVKNTRLIYENEREKKIVVDYIASLKILALEYDDQDLLLMVQDFTKSELYIEVFDASVELAYKRKVPKEKVLNTKQKGDNYFRGVR